MTDLTEQWKKGELPEGYYYVKDGENMIAEYLDGYFYNDGNPMTSFSGGVDEVLAPVPSYEEWKASYNCMLENEVLRLKLAKMEEEKRWYSENLHAATDKINELKELLKQSRIYVKIETEDYDDRTVSKADKEEAKKLLTKIDEVLK